MRFYTKQRRIPYINIVSLVDILCILLIFFIVTTTFKKDEPRVEIKVPESSTATKDPHPQEPVIIYASKDLKIFVGPTEVPMEKLARVLRARKAEASTTVFALKADTDIPLGFFVKVLDASKEAGLTNLQMFTEPSKNKNP